MSILINMEMPKNCMSCPLVSGFIMWQEGRTPPTIDARLCRVRREMKYTMGEEKPDWCPLHELPPHGRLIDADVLCDVLMELEKNEYTPQVFARFICNHEEIFPTIIEADTCNNAEETCNKNEDDGVNASKTGKWIASKGLLHPLETSYVCSVCNSIAPIGVKRFFNFCPNCGADMRGGEDG